MRIVNRIRAWLGREATTVGISPKILAAPISAGIVWLIAQTGLSLDQIADLLNVSTTIVTGAIITLGALVAGWLLPPGTVVVPEATDISVGGSDARLDLSTLPPA